MSDMKFEKGIASPSQTLSHIKVLDLTRVRAGPTCVRQFADWGADVIKIESPDALAQSDGWGGLRDGPDFQNLHRNKRSLTLNLKDARGREAFMKLAATADVIVENFRPDVKFRLGIDYESVRAINPRIVYASISGFGQDGPYAKRPGFDHIIQGLGGMMSVNGHADKGPTRVGIAVADVGAGMFAALGVMTALLERQISNKGQWVQVSLLEAMIAMLDFQAARWLMSHEIPVQAGNDHPTSIPTGVFATADGFITIAAGEQAMWKRLCDALEAPALFAREAYASEESRSVNRAALAVDLTEYTKQRSNAEWMRRFEETHVAAGVINSMDAVFDDPQVQHLGIAQTVSHPELGPIPLVGQAFSMSRTPSQMVSSAPKRGEHTDEILRQCGYSETQIRAMQRENVV